LEEVNSTNRNRYYLLEFAIENGLLYSFLTLNTKSAEVNYGPKSKWLNTQLDYMLVNPGKSGLTTA